MPKNDLTQMPDNKCPWRRGGTVATSPSDHHLMSPRAGKSGKRIPFQADGSSCACGRVLSLLCTKSRRKKPQARRGLDGGCGPEISLPTLGRPCGVSSSSVLTKHTLCAALQKSRQRFGRPTAFKIVQGVEQGPARRSRGSRRCTFPRCRRACARKC